MMEDASVIGGAGALFSQRMPRRSVDFWAMARYLIKRGTTLVISGVVLTPMVPRLFWSK